MKNFPHILFLQLSLLGPSQKHLTFLLNVQMMLSHMQDLLEQIGILHVRNMWSSLYCNK